ncbi:MAG: hypothetical protein Q9167_002747 [Letrouitia subvulpina]
MAANTQKPVVFGAAESTADTPKPFTFGSTAGIPYPENPPYLFEYAEAQARHDKNVYQALRDELKAKEQALKERDAWQADSLKTKIIANESQKEHTETREKLAECEKARAAEKANFEEALESLRITIEQANAIEEQPRSLRITAEQANAMEEQLKRVDKERMELKLKNEDLWASKESAELEIQSLRKELDDRRDEQKVLKQNCSILEANKVEMTKAFDDAQTASKADKESLNVQLRTSRDNICKQRKKIKSLESGRQQREKEFTESLERAQPKKNRLSADYKALEERKTKELEAQREDFQMKFAAHKEACSAEARRWDEVNQQTKRDVGRFIRARDKINLNYRRLEDHQKSLQSKQESLQEKYDLREGRTESLADTVSDTMEASLTLRDELGPVTFGESRPPSPTSDDSIDQEADQEVAYGSSSKTEEKGTVMAFPQRGFSRKRKDPNLISGMTYFFERVLLLPESEVQKLKNQVFAPSILSHDRRRLLVASAAIGRSPEDLELALSSSGAPISGKSLFTSKRSWVPRDLRSKNPTIQRQAESQETVVGASDSTTQSGKDVRKMVYRDREMQTMHMTDDVPAPRVTVPEDPKAQDVIVYDARPKVLPKSSRGVDKNVVLSEPSLALIEPAVPVANQGHMEITYPTEQMIETGDTATLQSPSAQAEKENQEDSTGVVLGEPERSSSHGLTSVTMPDSSAERPRWMQTFRKPLFVAMFAIIILLVAWAACYGESARRERNLWLAANDLTRKAVVSLQAGGGTGTGVPAWLWNDPLLDNAGQTYEDF